VSDPRPHKPSKKAPADLWQMRTEARKAMLTPVRDRYARQRSAKCASIWIR
jgi:hypothetical protein